MAPTRDNAATLTVLGVLSKSKVSQVQDLSMDAPAFVRMPCPDRMDARTDGKIVFDSGSALVGDSLLNRSWFLFSKADDGMQVACAPGCGFTKGLRIEWPDKNCLTAHDTVESTIHDTRDGRCVEEVEIGAVSRVFRRRDDGTRRPRESINAITHNGNVPLLICGVPFLFWPFRTSG